MFFSNNHMFEYTMEISKKKNIQGRLYIIIFIFSVLSLLLQKEIVKTKKEKKILKEIKHSIMKYLFYLLSCISVTLLQVIMLIMCLKHLKCSLQFFSCFVLNFGIFTPCFLRLISIGVHAYFIYYLHITLQVLRMDSMNLTVWIN